MVTRLLVVMLVDALQDGSTDKVLTDFRMVGQVEKSLMDLICQASVALL